MSDRNYRSMPGFFTLKRREILKAGAALGAGLVLGTPRAWAQEAEKPTPPDKPKTNIDEVAGIPRTETSLPGAYPGRVVEVHDPTAVVEGAFDAAVVESMLHKGITALTGKSLEESFGVFFSPDDVVGIKVNPVGAGLISTRHEVVRPLVAWLEAGGVPRKNIIIFDRFESMLTEAGFTPENYPGVGLEALQILDEAAFEKDSQETGGFLDADGRHLSWELFDDDVVYRADVEADQSNNYLNQHVENGKNSRFAKLLTQRLTKFINVPVFKNTGNGISMATKNVGYGVINNTGRLHQPLFFDVCTEVLAFPCVRDKLVLNITDGLIGQYDGGPGPNAQFTWEYDRLFCATDPFALDRTCHDLLVVKRKEMEVQVNEHPRFTEYLRYAERLGLGVADPTKIEHVTV